MAKRSSRPDGAKKRPSRGVLIALWVIIGILFLVAICAILAIVSRVPMPIADAEAEITAEETEASAVPEESAAPAETPLPEELQEAPLSPDEEVAARTVVRSDGFPVLSHEPENFSLGSNGRMTYSGETYLTGIDVSEHQGKIDWEKVASDGVDFVMIRMGYRGSTAGGLYTDEYFTDNIAGANAAGIDVGVYFYSQAVTPEEALEEANYVLEAIRPYKVTFPVVFDWEIVGGSEARTYTVSRAVLCECAEVFCDAVEDAGYDAMIYFTQYLGYRKYILRRLTDYEFWYAEYEAQPRIVFDFDMWQYSSTGTVNGIDGDVDLNIYFREGNTA